MFEENGVSVDSDFVRFREKAFRVDEIKVVETGMNPTDRDTAKVAWFFAAILFLMSLVSPWFFILTVTTAALAVYKQGRPAVHTLRVSTGGLFNSQMYQSTDGEHIQRLRRAIEAAISRKSNITPSETSDAPHTGQPLTGLAGRRPGPWG